MRHLNSEKSTAFHVFFNKHVRTVRSAHLGVTLKLSQVSDTSSVPTINHTSISERNAILSTLKAKRTNSQEPQSFDRQRRVESTHDDLEVFLVGKNEKPNPTNLQRFTRKVSRRNQFTVAASRFHQQAQILVSLVKRQKLDPVDLTVSSVSEIM